MLYISQSTKKFIFLEHARKKKILGFWVKMKNKELNSNVDAEFGEVLKKKERHIVSWSQEVVFLFFF